MRGHMSDPGKRLAGAMIGGLSSMLLFIIASAGVVRGWLALRGI
jgi:hypothetical protein